MIKLVSLPFSDSLDDKLDPPLGLMYIAAVLEQNHIPVEILDLSFVPRNQWKEAIGAPDILGVSIMTPTLHIATEILHSTKRNSPKTIVAAGGPHPSCLPFETLREGFDAVFVGEAEYTFTQFALKEPSLPFQKPHNQRKQSPIDVNLLPFPARHLVNLKAYTRKVAGLPATSIITSRGCPYNCAFCDKSVHGQGVRFRKIPSVIEEIRQVQQQYDINAFKFDDDTFTVNKVRLLSLLYDLQKLKILFRCQGNTRTDTYPDFLRLYEVGCRQIIFGIESGSQTILNRINKQVTVEKNRKAILNAKKAGLTVRANLMVGNPGETWDTIEETLNFIKETQPQQWIVSNFIPLPGCPIYKDPAAYGITIKVMDWQQYFTVTGKNIGGLTHTTDDNEYGRHSGCQSILNQELTPANGFYRRLHQGAEKVKLNLGCGQKEKTAS